MKQQTRKNKHLTFDDRVAIQENLCKGKSFKAIGKLLDKSACTISREVKLHLKVHENNFCRTDKVCPQLLKAPFVCNGCDKRTRSSCPHKRQLYSASIAQKEYEALLSEARTGVALNKESFYRTERIISNAVKNGQHIYHAIKSNNLPVSTATVYRHIKSQYYSITVMDLPRVVKFKPRKNVNKEFIPNWAKQGRTYNDYLEHIETFGNPPIVQLDTVIGAVGGKVIMTLHFVNSNFMIGLLMENKTAAEAADKIIKLKSQMKTNGFIFGDIIPVLLTDNGGEFSIVSAFENDADGNAESHLFFCEPHSPHEKAHIEKNHTLFRDIVPSGTSFDSLTQEDLNLIFSHVNSVKRKHFNGKSAYEMFSFYHSDILANTLGISYILPENVIQTPKLLKQIFSK